MKQARRKFDSAFKAKVALEAIRERETLSGLTSGGAITYNHLNLPTQIVVKKDDGTDKGNITYTYDASGQKLSKQTTDQSTAVVTITTTTHYIGGSLYESRTTTPADAAAPDYTHKLQYASHPEGCIRALYNNAATPNALTGFAYDYFL